MGQFIDLTGQQFGYLTVIEREPKSLTKSKGAVMWRCKCSCGKETVVRSRSLRNGDTRSCGCYRAVSDNPRGFKHGYTGNRIYAEYIDMRKRCRPDYKNHKRYYDRGIDMCDEWKGENGVHAFFLWAQNSGYRDDLTLDRIDNDKGYSPDNCRWATVKEQANNRSTTVKVTRNGVTKSLAEWADEVGIKRGTLYRRLHVYGYDIEKALTEPVSYNHR